MTVMNPQPASHKRLEMSNCRPSEMPIEGSNRARRGLRRRNGRLALQHAHELQLHGQLNLRITEGNRMSASRMK